MSVSDCWNRPQDVKGFVCFQYGGPHAPCTLNIQNDPEDGMLKDPSACKEDTFHLWDEPKTQHKTNQWAGSAWMTYAKKWAPQLRAARARGMKITTPFLSSSGGDLQAQFQDFFSSCSGCNDPKSPLYINHIAFNSWIGAWGKQSDEEVFIKNTAASLKQKYGRDVYLGSYAFLGGRTATQQVSIINGQIFDPAFSVLSGVYYFAAKDFGGGTTNNDLSTVVESGPSNGRTLGQVLRARCRVPQVIANVSEVSSSQAIIFA